MNYLCNGFSVHMIPQMHCGEWETIQIKRINSDEARDLLQNGKFKSYFGHVDTVKYLEKRWRLHIPVSREQVIFRKGDRMVIATITSKRKWEQSNHGYSSPTFMFFLVSYL